MIRRRLRLPARILFLAAAGAIAILAQACGGGSAGVDATPTAKPLPTLARGDETPAARLPIGPRGQGDGPLADTTPPAGDLRQVFRIGGPSDELAAFLGIPQEQLETELGTEGATLASVAEAHGRTREELRSFFIEQVEANLSEAVAAGSMSQEDADDLMENLSSRIDNILDGQVPSGRPEQVPSKE